mgnify:CR=1 FL=1
MLIKLAAPAAQASGKQGAELVFFSWRGQQCARTYAIPSQPRTALQSQIRGVFATAQSGWAALTLSQQAAWNAYAEAHPTTDRLGRAVAPTGRNAYTAINWYNEAVGYELLTDPSGILSPAAPYALTSAATTAGNLVLTFTHAESPAGQAGAWTLFAEAWIAPTGGYTTGGSRLVYVGKSLDQSRVTVSESDQTTVLTVAALDLNPYIGTPADGKRIFVRATLCAAVGGYSAPFEGSALLS